MNAFKTSRVLILDDKADEAAPVIKALGLLGVGGVYHDGNKANAYPNKLLGIRVLFADMVLAEHGADSNDPAKCAEFTADSLKLILEDTTDPLVVVCWTAHKDIVGEFEKAFKKNFPKIRVSKFKLADKATLTANPAQLRDLVSTALSEHDPMHLFIHWQQSVHDAANETTRVITELIYEHDKENPGKWGEYAYKISAALALAERGSRIVEESPDRSIKSLYDALNPLLIDCLDHATVDSSGSLKPVAETLHKAVVAENTQQINGRATAETASTRKAAIEYLQEEKILQPEELAKLKAPEMTADSLLNLNLRAALNTRLHLTTSVIRGERVPGTTYLIERNTQNNQVFGQFIAWDEALKDTFCPVTAEHPKNQIPFIVEITPICDFAQAKAKLPRFVLGFLVPDTEYDFIRKSEIHVKKLGPLRIDLTFSTKNKAAPTTTLAGEYWLVFNAHYLPSLTGKLATQLEASYRLRSPALADVASWVGNHSTRPGMLHIGP